MVSMTFRERGIMTQEQLPELILQAETPSLRNVRIVAFSHREVTADEILEAASNWTQRLLEQTDEKEESKEDLEHEIQKQIVWRNL